MNLEKYNREIPMECPTCANTDFRTIEGQENVTCNRCERVLMKNDLIDFNNNKIEQNIKETVQQITPEIEKEIKNIFKKAFKNNKMFKIK